IELLDVVAMHTGGAGYPGAAPPGALVLAEAAGSAHEAAAMRDELTEAMSDGALAVETLGDTAAVWRWRDGLSGRLAAARGAKLSEDVVVPLDRLGDLIAAVLEIGERHGLDALSFGHAGDGNMHSSFLYEPGRPEQWEAALQARDELLR